MGSCPLNRIMNSVISCMLFVFFQLNLTLAEEISNESNDILEEMTIDKVQTVEGFMKTKEFKAIIGGCACFWGSILGMGMTYMLVVLLKKWFEPQEIAKEED